MTIPESIYKEFDKIVEIDNSDRDKLLAAIDEVIRHLQNLLADPEYSNFSNIKAELLYLIGYAYYKYPYRNENVYENVDKYLLLAIDIKPDYSIAWLYLGHNAYDMGRYSNAKERFSRCQEDHFSSFYKLILLEMKLCCSIKIEGLGQMIGEIEKFIEKLKNHDTPQDILPYVLISILKKDVVNLEDFDKSKANILLSQLEDF